MALRILLVLVLGLLTVMGRPGAGAADLVAYYPLDGHACDASGYHHDASEVQATEATGRFGGAYYFEGKETSYIKVPTAVDFNIDPNLGFTIAFWVYIDPAASPSQFSVMDYGEGWRIQADAGYPEEPTAPRPLWFFAGMEAGFEGSFATPPFGVWCHVAWKFENLGGQYGLSGFLDGNSESYTTLAGVVVNGLGDLYFGKSALDNCDPFTGYLDEVRIFNTALSDQEIADLSRLNPVPLPGSLLLLGTGLLGLAGVRRFLS